jgi:hypothetical protein
MHMLRSRPLLEDMLEDYGRVPNHIVTFHQWPNCRTITGTYCGLVRTDP